MAKEVKGRTKKIQQTSVLLLLMVVVLVKTPGNNAAHTSKLESSTLQAISPGNATVTKLLFDENQITLNDEDRRVLATYPKLEELHLDGNLVSYLPANYFTVVPQLQVLSLSRNKISSLDPESFSGLDILTELDLSNNLLTNIHIQLFRQLHKIPVLRLKGNPWNCSCPLLKTAGDGKQADGSNFTCAFLKSQEVREFIQITSVCDSLIQSRQKRDKTKPVTVSFQQSSTTLSILSTTTGQDTVKDETPVVSNTWKFTACVASLALFTLIVVICAIKGPSWYKLFHNYRHRQLQQEEEDDIISTVFTKRSSSTTNQTFTFKPQNGQIEEDDGYIEDQFIEREGESAKHRSKEMITTLSD